MNNIRKGGIEMKQIPEPNMLSYRRTMSAIGGLLISFFVLLTLSGALIGWLGDLLFLIGIPNPQMDILYYCFYAVLYLIVFLVPLIGFRPAMRKAGRKYRPVRVDVRPSWLIFPILFGGIALIWAQSHINSAAVGIFSYSFVGGLSLVSGYQIVLEFLVSALLPAFCEELLFRGAIMENLLPFGRQNAIFASAFLFAIAHQNVAQMLYAFAAGILFGLLYERTGSIWNCVLLHLVNNFLSVIIVVLSAQFGKNAPIGYLLVEGSFYLLGVLSTVLLAFLLFAKRPDLSEGVFGKSVEAWDGYAECPIPKEGRIKSFLRPSILIFVIVCILQASLLIAQTYFV